MRADELLAQLREMVDQSRDDEDPTFYWPIEHGAHLAAAFDELDSILQKGGDLPAAWRH